MSAIPRTSIIMPVYNTASTVIAAIKSVLAQTDPNFELLVMIDGSPDHSAQLIADYLQQNPDERLHYHAERTGAQVVNCAHNMVATDGSTTQRLKGTPGTLTGQEAAFALLKDELSPYAWDKIIRRELFEGVRAAVRVRGERGKPDVEPYYSPV